MQVPGGVTVALLVAVGTAVALGWFVATREVEDTATTDVAVGDLHPGRAPLDSPAVLVGRPVPSAPQAPGVYADETDVRTLVLAAGVGNEAQGRLVVLGQRHAGVVAQLVDWLRPEHDKDRYARYPPGTRFSGSGVPGLHALQDTLRRLAPRSVDALVAALSDDDPAFRWRVAACLGSFGEGAGAAVTALAARLEPGREEDVRGQCAMLQALGLIGAPARVALPIFHTYLRDERYDDDARAAAAEGFLLIAEPGPEVFKTCSLALSDQSFEVCARLVPAIAEMGGDAEPLLPALLALVQDPYAHGIVRRQAVLAIGRIGSGGKIAIRVLLDILVDDGEEDVTRATAVAALARLGPEGTDALFRALASADVYTVFLAVETLCAMEAAQRVDPARLLVTLDGMMRSASAEDRAEAVYHASRIPDAGDVLVPWLEGKLEGSDPAIHGAALGALCGQNDPTGRVVRLLLGRLGSPDPAIRRGALGGLSRRIEENCGDEAALRSDPVVRALLAGLVEPDAAFRLAALQTLHGYAERFGSAGGQFDELVLAMVNDENWSLRATAAVWIVDYAPQHRQRTLSYWIAQLKQGHADPRGWSVLKEAGPKAKEALPDLLKIRKQTNWSGMQKALDEIIEAIRNK